MLRGTASCAIAAYTLVQLDFLLHHEDGVI